MDTNRHESKDPKAEEIWSHEIHGDVRIVYKWNWREYVCEIPAQGNRRAILARELMKPKT